MNIAPDSSGMERDPDVKLGGLSIWVLGRAGPQSDDYGEEIWLEVVARVEAAGACVEARGSWLQNSELSAFLDQLEVVYRDLKGAAVLDCMEAYLGAKVECGSRGGLEVVVSLTPDYASQAHQFTFELDQSFLVETMRGCKRVLERFPIKANE